MLSQHNEMHVRTTMTAWSNLVLTVFPNEKKTDETLTSIIAQQKVVSNMLQFHSLQGKIFKMQ